MGAWARRLTGGRQAKPGHSCTGCPGTRGEPFERSGDGRRNDWRTADRQAKPTHSGISASPPAVATTKQLETGMPRQRMGSEMRKERQQQTEADQAKPPDSGLLPQITQGHSSRTQGRRGSSRSHSRKLSSSRSHKGTRRASEGLQATHRGNHTRRGSRTLYGAYRGHRAGGALRATRRPGCWPAYDTLGEVLRRWPGLRIGCGDRAAHLSEAGRERGCRGIPTKLTPLNQPNARRAARERSQEHQSQRQRSEARSAFIHLGGNSHALWPPDRWDSGMPV